MSMSDADVAALEEMNFNAWPSLQCVHIDGWLVRKTGGMSRRVNSVNAIGPGRLPLHERILQCERLFEYWGMRSVFRITPLCESGLEALLTSRGYTSEGPTDVMVAELHAREVDPRVELATRFQPDWASASASLRGLPDKEALILAAQHRLIAVPTIWALVKIDGKIAGVGVAALERGWAGLHGIIVDQSNRRNGIARAVSTSLLETAFRAGARRAWLQVEVANTAAISLYASLGFSTAWSYHHLVRSM